VESVAISTEQLNLLVQRLYERTRVGAVKWDSTLGKNRYQTRFGDFVILLQADSIPIESNMVITLDVKRLSGTFVTSITTSAFTMVSRRTAISPDTQEALRNLFDLIDNKSDEIDELIGLIP
jgi:hypothetical protein